MMLPEADPTVHTSATSLTSPLCPSPSPPPSRLSQCPATSPGIRRHLDRLSPLVERFSPLRKRLRVLLPVRSQGRWLLVLLAVSVLMMVLLSYSRSYPRPGWLTFLGASHRAGECPLVCREVKVMGRWNPRPVPIQHACLATAPLPVPCLPNATRSEVLEKPPIHFLPNFRNPCWYEDLPTITPSPVNQSNAGDYDPGFAKDFDTPNPYYSHNLFACFSHVMRRLFIELGHEFNTRQWSGQGPRRRLRCLPYFYIAGMPKSGSTDLFKKVMQHPDVVRPPFKEPHWWAKNRFGVRLNFSSAVSLSDYIDLFDNAAIQIENRQQSHGKDKGKAGIYHPVITGDASASTFWSNDEWWRLPENCGLTEPRFTNAHHIHRLTPHARIIVILRNPTDRLFSDYLYFTKTNKSAANFHQDVVQSIEKLRECMATQTLRACIYDKQVANGVAKVRLRVGVYHIYMAEWLKVFPPDQLLVLRTEDYSKDIRSALRQVFNFLGLRQLRRGQEDEVVGLPIANTRKMKDRDVGPMLDRTRQALHEFYQPHNQLLARLLQDQRFLWKDVQVKTQSDDVGSVPSDGEEGVSRSEGEEDNGGGSDGGGSDGGGSGGGVHSDEASTFLKDEQGSLTPSDVTKDVSDDVTTTSTATDPFVSESTTDDETDGYHTTSETEE
ncbi:carbohydrate sulfotransferase 15-like [Babylonia areolata]|uniref:carbohydrate sulfotransferase 15-like n=1 Tax=Babylonia areolata TaxID=304850 RepID=UPI003FD2A481